MSFGDSNWFYLLVLLPIVAALYIFRQRRNEQLIAKIVSPRLREQLAGQVSIPLRVLRAILMLFTLSMIIVGLAKPRNGFEEQKIQAKGRDVLIAIDVSRSMLATDFPPTRLMRAKLFAQDLLRLLPGDRVGVIAFAGSSFLQAPLTLDSSAVLATIEELDPNVIPKGGTNIAAAVDTAIQAFGAEAGASRALIVVSDGEELDANGVAAAVTASKAGIRIFTVGVGSAEGSLIPIRSVHGKSDFVRDSEGKPVLSRLDIARMEEIAQKTGGFYTPLTPEAAKTVYEQGILPMKETLADMKEGRQPIEVYQWPTGAAIVALVLWLIIGERKRVGGGRRKRQPIFRSWRTRRDTRAYKQVLSFFCMMFVAVLRQIFSLLVILLTYVLFLAGVNNANAQVGLAKYQAGDFEGALGAFQRGIEEAPDRQRAEFDAGAAAYRLGQYDKAVNFFTQALLTKDRKLLGSVNYNLGNALVRLGEQSKAIDAKRKDWENAIEYYKQSLTIDPKNKLAEDNIEVVKKLLEQLDKEQQQQSQNQQDQQQQNQDQQQQCQNQQQSQESQQQQQDQDQQQQSNKPTEPQQSGEQPQPTKKDEQQENAQQNQEQPTKEESPPQREANNTQEPPQQASPEGQEREPQKKASSSQRDNSSQEQPEQKKKEGELKEQFGDSDSQKQPEQQGAAIEESESGTMSEAQARALLNSLDKDEERVRLNERARQQQQNVKDW